MAADKIANKGKVVMIIKTVWFTKDPVGVKQPGLNIFLFSFKSTANRNRVQIHGLPLKFMTKDNVIKIGNLFKAVLQCESSSRTNIIGTSSATNDWRNFVTESSDMGKMLACSQLLTTKSQMGIFMGLGYGQRQMPILYDSSSKAAVDRVEEESITPGEDKQLE
ncbi:hypothetical protein FEM48_Zijuj10G0027000 [Ziziphus jujuba var. spinosa]|uniref:Uncharacterized protein n=1 Tax=Ziziphus jujuba var. spinosa TaxID=714518 RepID=A0A978UKU3_ZIZJJ|nr:hypothetical protein FEM48_Zijuj10G0027000 [Ziziphus jujuba var. spinosa]